MTKTFRILASYVLAVIMVAGVFTAAFSVKTYAYQTDSGRPSNSGYLKVGDDGQLYTENGDFVQLRGVSTHGLLYYPEFVNERLISRVSSEWDANLLRLAVYSEDYCNGNEKESLELLYKGIDAAIDNNMYVIVDWHILNDNNPNMNLSKAVEFFSTVGRKYGKVPNIIYEICNEPNGDTTWDDIREYAYCVLPIIRNYNDSAIVIVGTPNYDRELKPAIENPITGYKNIMYAFHFYASSHGKDMRDELRNAFSAHLPVFISESGISPESGDGKIDYSEVSTWYGLVNNLGLSYTIWSLCNKDEASAMFNPGLKVPENFTEKDLTESGRFATRFIGGESPATIAQELESSKSGGILAEYLDVMANRWVFTALEALLLAAIAIVIFLIAQKASEKKTKTYPKLLKLTNGENGKRPKSIRTFGKILMILTCFFSIVYLLWRLNFSIPRYAGVAAIVCNIILLLVEGIGFVESLIHYMSMIRLKEYTLPEVNGEYPDVDIFVATYNEPVDLLRKTVYGCTQMEYPDKSKVHIYICDDKRRPQMRALAEELGVNYFDRPDNKGAKAGNLNAALARTSSPYVVTFDADMIPMKSFLMQTIPYFMDAEIRNAQLPDDKKIPLGFIQTPQCFYTPDVFQYNLYNETRIPNEQDFFYRTIEPAKTQQNCVIYGGSNTILSRAALNAIGGFYTETITEDFATGMLIEAAGFASLGLPKPLASGLSASTFKEHIQQRTRWGRGVISTAKQLKYGKNKNLTVLQKLNYWSSVFYWYSPVKNLVYILAPMMYAVLAVPMFVCTTKELILFWLPMLICQTIYLPMISNGSMSYTWSGIQEISVMPSLFLPIIQESLGISLTAFKVTDKSKKATGKEKDVKDMIPFFILIALSIFGIVRVIIQLKMIHAIGLIAVLFWLLRNLYFCIMALFLIDGRASDGEEVLVKDAELITVSSLDGKNFDGITTRLTEHNLSCYFDDANAFKLGQPVAISLMTDEGEMNLKGSVVGVKKSNRDNMGDVYTIEILDFGENTNKYVYHLYNRVPSLPQSLKRNIGPFRNLWINFAKHLDYNG